MSEITSPPADDELPPALKNSISRILRTVADGSFKDEDIPAYFKSKSAREAFKNTFELIGGLPRFALWADKNYDTFIRLFSRQLAAQTAGDSVDEPFYIEVRWGNGERFSQDQVEDAVIIPKRSATPVPAEPEQQLQLFGA
jgi:hypothetical protein